MLLHGKCISSSVNFRPDQVCGVMYLGSCILTILFMSRCVADQDLQMVYKASLNASQLWSYTGFLRFKFCKARVWIKYHSTVNFFFSLFRAIKAGSNQAYLCFQSALSAMRQSLLTAVPEIAADLRIHRSSVAASWIEEGNERDARCWETLYGLHKTRSLET